MLDIREDKDGVTFRVKVQPRASKNQLAGVMDGAVRVRLTAPPVDGEANQACLKFFAHLLGVPLRSVELVSGHTGRNKTLRVCGLSSARVTELLNCS
ncbi:MAG: hypothetical protein JL50_19050 [Peptococcaceae bacterium BICA1-7]|nr:MAG: hypothetical protein JL50_19050 [Peptococcaceae bacterium BICA1-7]HBV98963.1 YggU family protein [Desulfotomaculum sp.]